MSGQETLRLGTETAEGTAVNHRSEDHKTQEEN